MAAIVPSHRKGMHMTLADLCLILAALFAFATLILKVVEVARGK